MTEEPLDRKTEVRLLEKAKSRKFLFSVGVCIASTALVYLKAIDPATYAQIMNVAMLGYLTGNVAESALTKR